MIHSNVYTTEVGLNNQHKLLFIENNLVFFLQYPFLTWLDLRGVPLLYADAQVLGLGLRGQYNMARSI